MKNLAEPIEEGRLWGTMSIGFLVLETNFRDSFRRVGLMGADEAGSTIGRGLSRSPGLSQRPKTWHHPWTWDMRGPINDGYADS